MPGQRMSAKLRGGFLSYPEMVALGPYWNTIPVDTPEFTAWLNRPDVKSFSYENELSIVCETKQRGGRYWFAHKKIAGRTRKKYIGRAEDVTAVKLREVARYFRQLAVESSKEP